jgi:hypothetical protein
MSCGVKGLRVVPQQSSVLAKIRGNDLPLAIHWISRTTRNRCPMHSFSEPRLG